MNKLLRLTQISLYASCFLLGFFGCSEEPQRKEVSRIDAGTIISGDAQPATQYSTYPNYQIKTDKYTVNIHVVPSAIPVEAKAYFVKFNDDTWGFTWEGSQTIFFLW